MGSALRRGLLLCLIGAGLGSFPSYSQLSSAYQNPLSAYQDGLDLYNKAKYSAAQETFDNFCKSGTVTRHNESFVNAQYLAALCAVELKREDAEHRLLNFENQFPHSPQVQSVYFQLGKLYFDQKRWKPALDWLDKTDKFTLSTTELAEYYFKMGYACNQLGKRQEAFNAFAEIKGTDNAYKYPALYYYSHMAYEDKNYQVALEGFLELSAAGKFMSMVPYYISQIYYLQHKYQEVINYAKPLLDTSGDKRIAELNQMLGNSYYELKKYPDAIPYLEKYAALKPQDRTDNYRLGYSYYMHQQYKQAINRFGYVTREEDEMTQKAWYHMGDCYIHEDKKTEARNCYDRARKMKFDTGITEDAFYSYARLSYELSFNPYHDAIRVMSEYLKTYPGNIHRDEVYTYLVNMYVAGKNYESAWQSLSEIGNKNPNMQRAYQFVAYNLGIDYLNKKEYKKAGEMLREVKTYPVDKELNAMSHYWVSESYFLRKEYTTAINEYKSFMQQPGAFKLTIYNRANYNIAWAFMEMGYEENKDAMRTGNIDFANYNQALDYFRIFVGDQKEHDKERLQDANLRIGDIYYLKSDNANASKFYAQAASLGSSDYALFQKAMCDGYVGKKQEKITALKNLLQQYPKSRYGADAKFEIAQTYAVIDKKEDALQYYNKVIQEHPDNIARVKYAYFETALICYQLKQYKKSEDTYKLILDKYPNPTDQKEAFARMKAVYADRNRVDDWLALMKKYNQLDQNINAADTAYYEKAEEFHDNGDWDNAIKMFEKYLDEFKPAHFALQAHFYLADSYVAKGMAEKSITHFEYVLQQPNSPFTQHATISLARIYMQRENTAKAIELYTQVEKTSSSGSHVTEARNALLDLYIRNKDWQNAATYADKVLADQPKDDEQKARCRYAKGKAALERNDAASAKTEFTQVAKLTKTEIKAEAGYLMCNIRYENKEYKTAEKELYDFFKQKPSYSYWLAKGYILLARNYAALKDTTQARATLQSIIDNYKTTDDDILTSAQEFLNAFTPAPVNKSAVVPEGEIPLREENGGNNQIPKKNEEE